jgi:hypothetical protein
MPAWTDLRDRYPLVLALIGPLAVAALMIPLRNHVQNTDLALVMVVAMALLVLPGRRVAAVVAGVSGGPGSISFSPDRTSGSRSSAARTSRPPCCWPWWAFSSARSPPGDA